MLKWDRQKKRGKKEGQTWCEVGMKERIKIERKLK